MNPFAYLWNRFKLTGFWVFHKELKRGWVMQSLWNKCTDALLFTVGLLLALTEGLMGVGYFMLVILVLGQGWIINCLNVDLRNSHGAFLRIMEILHEERKERNHEDSGA